MTTNDNPLGHHDPATTTANYTQADREWSTRFDRLLAGRLWLDRECDRLLASARAGCSCAPYREPCPEHSAYEDGLADLADAVTRRWIRPS